MDNSTKKWIKENADILDRIFRPKYEEEREKVFSMPEGKARNIHIEFTKQLKNWLTEINLIKGWKESNPESEI
jgi:hypothetical protein